jgi:hypothetical protein
MPTVGSRQQGSFSIPINGTSPVDANSVRANDNAIATTYNGHDADPTIHVQSSTLAARPTAGVIGRFWFVTDDGRLYYDNGSVWTALQIDAGDIAAGTLPIARLPTITPAKGGTGLTATPTNGQIPVGNGSGYVLATIVAGNNCTVTNGPGTIQIDVTGLASGVSGSGAVNKIPKLVGTSTIGDSLISENGSNVAINTPHNAGYMLNVGGGIRAAGSAALSYNGVNYNMPGSQGAADAVLTNDGSGGLSWTAVSQPLDQQTFNSSGTWTKPTKGSMALIEVWGAGGSGSNSNSSSQCHGGAGGSGVWRLIKLSDLGATETVTIGAGGASRTIAQSGQNGGNSSFGSWVTGYGGSGGIVTSATDQAVTPGSAVRAGLGTSVAPYFRGAIMTAANLAVVFDYWERTYSGGWATIDPGVDPGQIRHGYWGGGAGADYNNTPAAGTSVYGGNGGAAGVDGVQPAGGGGAGTLTGGGRSGAGGAGRVRITVW